MITIEIRDDGTLVVDQGSRYTPDTLPEHLREKYFLMHATDPSTSIKGVGYRFTKAVWIYEDLSDEYVGAKASNQLDQLY